MPTLRDHEDCARANSTCDKCGGRVFWGFADGPAAVLVLEGCCSWCGVLSYTGDILAGASVVQPIPQVQRRSGPTKRRGGGGRKAGGWGSLHAGFFQRAS